MHGSAEPVDTFIERNQVESVEESIAVPSWKRSARLRLILERITTKLHP
jgi:hypothetical protein